jgi:hypothetical protein
MSEEEHLCGYGNCFRPATKKRGFLWVCDFHLKHPKKWGEDGKTFTGTVWIKKDVSVLTGFAPKP